MNLNIIDTTFIGIAILFTLIVLLDTNYISAYITTQNYADSLPDAASMLTKTMINITIYLLILFGWYATKYLFKHFNFNNIDATFMCIAISYTIIAIGYQKYIDYYKIKQGPTLIMLQTIVNVFVYMGILIAWFFTKEAKKTNNPTLVSTAGTAVAAILVTGILLYITIEGLEYVMEKGAVNDSTIQNNALTPEKDYCPDYCNFFTTNDMCTTNKSWNGVTCVWNASQQLCSTPQPTKPWLRNIIRTILVIITIFILILILVSQDDIVNIIKQYPYLKWLLDIPDHILKSIDQYKEDIKITTPTIWILITFEIIMLGLYFFGNLFAYQAYHRYGILIHNPPLGLSYKTKVGCNALNAIHTYQTDYTDDIDKHKSFTIKEGALTDFLPISEKTKNKIIDDYGPIPNKTYTMSTDFIIHRDNTTKKVADNNSINYNYGISMWIYVDPHQPTKLNNWFSFFSFDYKPSILYNPKLNSMLLAVQENITSTTVIEDSIKYSKPVKNIPLQKWNHLFINNMGSKCDLFLNGEIVTTIKQAIPQNKTNTITTGAHNGIVGRICNIYYFKKPLNGTEILDIYHKYKKYDPPMAF